LLLLSLFLLLRLGLLLFLFRGVITLLPLLILLRSGLFLLLRGVVLPFWFCRIVSLLLLLFLLLRFPGLGLLLLLVLPCVSRKTDSEQQKERRRLNDSNSFHGVTSVAFTSAPNI